MMGLTGEISLLLTAALRSLADVEHQAIGIHKRFLRRSKTMSNLHPYVGSKGKSSPHGAPVYYLLVLRVVLVSPLSACALFAVPSVKNTELQ